MQAFLNQPLQIGNLSLPCRLIQGPLAGISTAPFRLLYNRYQTPAYCVSEMISAHDVLSKHKPNSRYLYRAPHERKLAYQLSGTDPVTLAKASERLEALGADMIDLNCGCPKPKIRKKGAGSALLDNPAKIGGIIEAIRKITTIPLTVKIRIHGDTRDEALVKVIESAGADALIIHGRRWTEHYDIPANWARIGYLKNRLSIPVIANGDIADLPSLQKAMALSGCDGYMISRAGSGQPWLYQHLLHPEAKKEISISERIDAFMQHIHGLAALENEFQAVLQSKNLIRYYFRGLLNREQLQPFYALTQLAEMEKTSSFFRDLLPCD